MTTITEENTTIQLTVTGIINYPPWSFPTNYDQLGLFGPGSPNAYTTTGPVSLSVGTPFSVTFTFDTDAGGRTTTSTSDSIGAQLAFANATVTINGQSASIFGTPPYTSIGTWNAADGNLGHTGLNAYVRTDYTKIGSLTFTDFVYIDINSLALPTSLTAPFHYTLAGQDYSDGEIGFGVNNYYINNGDYYPDTRAFLRVSTVDLVPINVTDVNDNGPVITTAANQTVPENIKFVGALTSTDVDTVGINPAIFSITGGFDAALFQVVMATDGSQSLQFVTAPDYETNPHSYQVQVSAYDGVNTTAKMITVDVTDVNDNAPVITMAATQTVFENTVLVAALTSTDDDTVGINPATFSISGGADAALFDIVGGNLVFQTAPDYETDPHSYQVEVSAFDGVNTTTKTITVNLTDVNEAPTAVALANATTSILEDTPTAMHIKVADINVTDDALGGNILALTGADAASFEIVGSALYLKAGTVLDFESKTSYAVAVTVDDPTLGATPDATSTIYALDVSNVPGVTITGTSAANTIDATHTVAGQPLPTNEEDTINAGGGNDTIHALGGNDVINGGASADTMFGGTGNDTYVVDNAGDIVNETGGNGLDTVQSSITFSLSDAVHAIGVIENLTLTGTAAINGTGNALANVIIGNSGNNVIAGLGGADILDGGGGTDTATYATSPAGVNVSLMTGLGNGGDAQGDNLSNFKNLTGSNFSDTLEGNAGANVLNGGAGIDTVSYEHAAAAVTVNLATTSAQNTGGAGSDSLSKFENLIGSAYNDTLTGSAGANTINGGAGNDAIKGGGGADILTGGPGSDSFVFAALTDSPPAAPDTITDFTHGADIINLSAIDADTGKGGDQAFLFGDQNANVVAHSVTWTESGGNTIVHADVHGNTTADFTIILAGIHLHLMASDFIL